MPMQTPPEKLLTLVEVAELLQIAEKTVYKHSRTLCGFKPVGLIMDAGTVVEFDHPYNLLKNKDGFLYKMVEQTGIITSELLHTMASEVLYNYLFFLTAFL